jgi:DNA-binding response OmpR family regulator
MTAEELKGLSEMIGMGALKYFLLKVDPRKRMMFDPSESIQLQGHTGPFIQYTHARIRAILRRTRSGDRSGSGQPAEILRVGEVELDPATRTVLQKGQPVEFTSVEFNLLHVLLREAGRVVPRERLVDIVLSRKFSPFDRSIDMHVSKIRKKLGDSDSGVDHIKTVRGVGYIFTRPQEVAVDKVRSGG